MCVLGYVEWSEDLDDSYQQDYVASFVIGELVNANTQRIHNSPGL